jgi:cysteine synthase A
LFYHKGYFTGGIMRIVINGKGLSLKQRTVSLCDALARAGMLALQMEVTVNGAILSPKEIGAFILREGDRVETRMLASLHSSSHSLSGLIGRTPAACLNLLPCKGSARILAKLEMFNPGGSVKDRIARSMIEDAEKKGILKKNALVVEPTSGNTGIGLAMICAARGYRCVLTMPDAMSIERIRIMRAYGAHIEMTPASEGMVGAIASARKIAEQEKGFMPLQFENPANTEAHRNTTAQEILALSGTIDAFVAGVGTGGTISGVGEVLKKIFPSVKIIAVEPSSSPVLSGGEKGPHKIQGIGAGFIPKILNMSVIDGIEEVSDEEAFSCAQDLAVKEGLFVGISSGAACVAALRVGSALGTGKTVVTLFPDSGERYLSVPGFSE